MSWKNRGGKFMNFPDRSVNHPSDQDLPVRCSHLAAEMVGRYTSRRRGFLSEYVWSAAWPIADLTSPPSGDNIPLPL